MNVQAIAAPVTRVAGKALLKARKHAPEVMLVAGIGGIIAATVEACNTTTKAGDVLDEFNDQRNQIKEIKESPEMAEIRESMGYTDFAYRKEMAGLYFTYTLKVLRVYWKPIVIGVGSLALILGSHGILRKRVTSLTAAYATLDTAFKTYRKRVVDELGIEKDREFRTGIRKIKNAAVAAIDEKTGEEKITKQTVDAIDKNDLNDPSDYGRWFAEGTTLQWDKSPIYNEAFLKGQQAVFNNILQSRGYVFLNEVYDQLGYPMTSTGAVTGWLKHGKGDGHIDFGIVGCEHFINEKGDAYINNGNAYYLDFNVDGVIWDKI